MRFGLVPNALDCNDGSRLKKHYLTVCSFSPCNTLTISFAIVHRKDLKSIVHESNNSKRQKLN